VSRTEQEGVSRRASARGRRLEGPGQLLEGPGRWKGVGRAVLEGLGCQLGGSGRRLEGWRASAGGRELEGDVRLGMWLTGRLEGVSSRAASGWPRAAAGGTRVTAGGTRVTAGGSRPTWHVACGEPGSWSGTCDLAHGSRGGRRGPA
jgi:hypothetical protein